MVKDYLELLEEDYQRQIEFLNIKKYHDMGYKGKGKVVLIAEYPGDHTDMTSGVVKDIAPEATVLESPINIKTSDGKVIEATVTIDNERLDFENAIDKYDIKVITRSYSGKTPDATLSYLKDIQKRKGVIFFNSAGNEGVDGVTGVWSKDDTAIAVGAAYLTEKGEIKLHNYSARGDELDFVSFMARGTGTSAASPALTAQTVLLLQRYGDFTQAECVEILKSLCIRLPELSNQEQGWGLPILPLTDKLEILEQLRGENMDFKDVHESDWFYKDVKYCVENGLMQGDGDDTFDPYKTVTRAEEAATTRRIHESIMNEIKKLK
jgi:hypothetical protein